MQHIIYAHIEAKLNNKWEHYSQAVIQDNNPLCAILFKRIYNLPEAAQSEVKQVARFYFPTDASVVTQNDWKYFQKNGAELPCVLDLNQFVKAEERFKAINRFTDLYQVTPSLSHLFHTPIGYLMDYGYKDVRIICWLVDFNKI